MYRNLSKQTHFRAQEGSSSIRVTQRGYGGKSLPGDPLTLLRSLKEQMAVVTARIEELNRLIGAAPSKQEAEALRRELARKAEWHGQMRRTVFQGCMQALERCFLDVARARLPEDIFMELMQEARGFWEQTEFAELVPPMNKSERRRASRKMVHKNWKRSAE